MYKFLSVSTRIMLKKMCARYVLGKLYLLENEYSGIQTGFCEFKIVGTTYRNFYPLYRTEFKRQKEAMFHF